MSSNRNQNILEHIISYCNDISHTLVRIHYNFQEFETDKDFKNSISMSLMQIGELSTHLSEDFKLSTKHEIPWGLIKGMRNHYAHGYAFMDNKEIFETAVNDIPELKLKCQQIIQEKQKEQNIKTDKTKKGFTI